jgi:hypothetical protein
MPRLIPRVVGVISGAGSALGASAAGHDNIAIGVLVLTGLALLGDLLAAILRDHTFKRIAFESNPDARVLRELNIREAIRTGQLTSHDAANLLNNEPPDRTPSKETEHPHSPPIPRNSTTPITTPGATS